MEYFKSLNKGNEMWGMIAEQILLGQLNPMMLKLSNGMIIKPKLVASVLDKSGTGKGLLQLLLEHASSEIGKVMKITEDDVTDDNNKRVGNEKIIFDIIVESQEAGLTGTVVKHEIAYGMLYYCDILIFPEASSLFVKTEHKKPMVMTLQCAMEDNGYVSKIVAGKRIRYKTNTSIILCSTPFDAADNILTKEGIFQRCIVSYNNRSFKELGDNFENSRLEVHEKTYKDKFKPCLKDITDALDFYKEESKYITIPTELNIIITKQMKEVFGNEREKVLNEKNRDIFDSYLMRAGTNTDKMALNMMFIKKKKKLDLECYEVPIMIFKHHIESIRKMFNGIKENTDKRGKGNKKIYNKDRVKFIIEEHDGNMTTLYKKIEDSESCSWVTARNIYKEVIEDANSSYKRN